MSFKSAVLTLVVLSVSALHAVQGAGFKVSGTSILDPNGIPFMMRGINHAHTWFKNDLARSIRAIAETGSNVVRFVLSNGHQYIRDDADSLQDLMDLCRENKIVAMPEVVDASGSDNKDDLMNAVDYWLDMADILRGTEEYVIINIANEWISTSDEEHAKLWADGYKEAIPKLRNAGLNHLIVVDSAGWGQYAVSIAEHGRSIFEADPQRNVVFSIHMYEVAAADKATVEANIDNALAIGVPVIIGEFSDAQNGKPVAYTAIMEYCQKKSVGWLNWVWFGGKSNPATANMDLSDGPDGGLLPLGEIIVNGELGIRKTGKPATIW